MSFDDASTFEKLQWHLAHCGRPDLIRVIEPEPRTYDAIIACPDAEMVAHLNAV